MERMSLLIIKKITLQITTRSKKEERKGRRVISRVKKKNSNGHHVSILIYKKK